MGAILCAFFFTANSQTIGIIGSATPGGWDVDTNMVKHPDSAHLWTMDITLIDGAVKFRKDDTWDTNWGSSDFPTGIGTQGGDDIPVFAGTYHITFDTLSGAYSFEVESVIGLIGDATANGWESDINMYEDTNGVFFVKADLTEGKAKFRLNDDWAVAWGGDDFPMGTASKTGGDIPVTKAGTYNITFDTLSGAYNFEELVTYSSIGILGDATGGGWDSATYLVQSASDPNLWEGNIELTEGEIKFRANDDWDVTWGSGTFPMDTAVMPGDNIAVIPGRYLVTFNTESGVYNFLEVIYYETIGLIGSAADGWEEDRDMTRSETDSAQWTLRTELLNGEAKFRADNDWIDSWGGGDFPSGIAGYNATSANIPVTEGEYIINFNTTTRTYEFIELVIYDTIGIVGSANGIDDGNSGWDSDIFLNKDAVDEQLWTLSPVDLVEGECKFRVNADWAINWGAADFPSGVGVQDGDNIPVPAGTYFVSFRSDEASYSFQPPSSVHSESLLNEVKIYPNPTDNFINIDMDSELITGNVNIEIIDVTGKKVISKVSAAQKSVRIDVSTLVPGTYFVKMYNKTFLVAKPISVK
ncbi:hypothetical protein GCM10007940_01650 [Portibacter lacus]|uniref:Secretion system C-terminal sorting domain-containing protein n=2 Tax=Portibacter lacus TaxID=1099794 RepID=A0AA37SK69_9BACT|nr:hypothetical protein GCM10007940_01650 [Portibacter lacus]